MAPPGDETVEPKIVEDQKLRHLDPKSSQKFQPKQKLSPKNGIFHIIQFLSPNSGLGWNFWELFGSKHLNF